MLPILRMPHGSQSWLVLVTLTLYDVLAETLRQLQESTGQRKKRYTISNTFPTIIAKPYDVTTH